MSHCLLKFSSLTAEFLQTAKGSMFPRHIRKCRLPSETDFMFCGFFEMNLPLLHVSRCVEPKLPFPSVKMAGILPYSFHWSIRHYLPLFSEFLKSVFFRYPKKTSQSKSCL